MDIVYIDFSKTFDNIPPGRLIQIRIPETTNWIHKWLNNRRQRVSLEGCFSKIETCESDVLYLLVLDPSVFL